MALRDIVQLVITRRNPTVTAAGFSTPLVLSYHSRFNDRMRSVTSVAELEALGFCSDDQAHKDVSAIFAQPRPPATVKIGRRALAFTQTLVLTPTAANATEYAVELDGLEATYTSDSSGTAAEIATGLTAAVNALGDVDAIVEAFATTVPGADLTGVSLDGAVGYRTMSPSRRLAFVLSSHADFDAGTATVTGKDAGGNTITETFTIPNGGNATVVGTKRFARVTRVQFPAASGTGGSWTLGTRAPMAATVTDTTNVTLAGVAGQVTLVEVTAGEISVDDTTSDPGISTDFAACVAEDPDFYGVLVDHNGPAEVLALAATIESHANRYLLMAVASESGCFDGDSITDVLYTLKDLLRYRAAPIVHPVFGVSAAAAWMGNGIAYTAGTVTWALREVVGLPTYTLTSDQRAAVLAKNGTLLETNAGRTHTVGGKVSGGEWVDIIHGIDRLHARMSERVFGALLAVSQDSKAPFTDAGIHLVDTEVRGQLKSDEAIGFLDAGWSTNAPRASSYTAAQRRSRVVSGLTWTAQPTGAIHAVEIAGTIGN
jgi:hypothetical protein